MYVDTNTISSREREEFLMKKEGIYFIQALISAVVAWLSDKLGILFPMLCIFAAMMIADQFSGMFASKKEAADNPNDPTLGWSSKKWNAGIYKKCGYIFAVGVAITIDYVILKTATYVGLTLSTKTIFGLLTIVWFILNELLSILENAGRLGAPLPEFLKNVLVVMKNKVEDKGDDENENIK